jgi:putative ABC transport system ATP-binding protein
MAAIEAFDLYQFYHAGEDETLALRGVTIHVDSGEIVAVMGPSGSGKSSLLHCLAGLSEPDGGYVEVFGQRLTRRSEADRAAIRARDIGIHLQSGNLFDHLSVEDNVLLQMQLARKFDSTRLSILLDQVGLTHRRHSLPTHLSGGEAARAGLAVALAANPRVVLADEPTGQVDAETEALVMRVFDAYRRSGSAILIVTHSDAVAAQADRVLRIHDGRIADE